MKKFVFAMLILCALFMLQVPVAGCAYLVIANNLDLSRVGEYAFGGVGIFWSTVAGMVNPLAGAAVSL